MWKFLGKTFLKYVFMVLYLEHFARELHIQRLEINITCPHQFDIRLEDKSERVRVRLVSSFCLIFRIFFMSAAAAPAPVTFELIVLVIQSIIKTASYRMYRIPPHSVTYVTLFETNKPVTLTRTQRHVTMPSSRFPSFLVVKMSYL